MYDTRTETKAAAENFPVALRVLPADVRSALMGVYAFARLVDDLGDESEADRVVMLEGAREELDLVFSGTPISPVFLALLGIVRAYGVPREPFDRLIDANLWDQWIDRYRSKSDLLEYCSLSANPVGEIVLHIAGAVTEERIRLSDGVCTALQIFEHLQDVREDYVAGRIYLPAEDMRTFGVDERELGESTASPRLRALVEHEARFAERMLNEAADLVGTLNGWARLAVAGYVAGGLATAAALRRARFDVLAQAVRPSKSQTFAEMTRLMMRRSR